MTIKYLQFTKQFNLSYSVTRETWADWTDTLLLVLCGGIPWQVSNILKSKVTEAKFSLHKNS